MCACAAPKPPTSSLESRQTQAPFPVVQRLTVTVYLDPSLGSVGAVQDYASHLLATAGDHLAARFGLELQVTRFVPWQDVPPGMTAAFEALEANGRGATDLALGFLYAPTDSRITAADRVMSRYLVPNFVLAPTSFGRPGGQKSTGNATDIQALLQGLGAIFGALPGCGDTVMSTELLATHKRSLKWGPTNARIIRLHAALDLARAHRMGLPQDLAQRVSKLLGQPGTDLACDKNGHLTRRRRIMAEILAPRIQAAAREAQTPPQAMASGLAALQAEDYATALAHCGPIAEGHPAGPATACAARAAEALGRDDLAIRFYRASLANGPKETKTRLALARLVGRAGDDAAARALLERCVADDPASTEARLNLGIARARLGDLDGARAAWRAVLDRDPAHVEAKKLLRQLDAQR